MRRVEGGERLPSLERTLGYWNSWLAGAAVCACARPAVQAAANRKAETMVSSWRPLSEEGAGRARPCVRRACAPAYGSPPPRAKAQHNAVQMFPAVSSWRLRGFLVAASSLRSRRVAAALSRASQPAPRPGLDRVPRARDGRQRMRHAVMPVRRARRKPAPAGRSPAWHWPGVARHSDTRWPARRGYRPASASGPGRRGGPGAR